MIDPDQFKDEARGLVQKAVDFMGENFWATLGVVFLLGVIAGAVGG